MREDAENRGEVSRMSGKGDFERRRLRGLVRAVLVDGMDTRTFRSPHCFCLACSFTKLGCLCLLTPQRGRGFACNRDVPRRRKAVTAVDDAAAAVAACKTCFKLLAAFVPERQPGERCGRTLMDLEETCVELSGFCFFIVSTCRFSCVGGV